MRHQATATKANDLFSAMHWVFPNFRRIEPVPRLTYWTKLLLAFLVMIPVGFVAAEIGIQLQSGFLAGALPMVAGLYVFVRIAGHVFEGRVLDAGIMTEDGFRRAGRWAMVAAVLALFWLPLQILWGLLALCFVVVIGIPSSRVLPRPSAGPDLRDL